MPAVRFRLIVLALLLCGAAPGCAWYDSLRGEGFQTWNDSLGGGSMRGPTQSAEPSGFFTDKRSDQIEKNLGGGY